MKPGDHPEFYRLPPPEGRSRESTIVLDGRGRFFHAGEPVVHVGLAAAFASWVSRHPDNGRYILSNGYDWCYLTVEATPFFIESFETATGTITLTDGSRELLDFGSLRSGDDGALCARVKGGAFDARFLRHAQLAIGELLLDGDDVTIEFRGERYRVG